VAALAATKTCKSAVVSIFVARARFRLGLDVMCSQKEPSLTSYLSRRLA
jgi:hypothetical protein